MSRRWKLPETDIGWGDEVQFRADGRMGVVVGLVIGPMNTGEEVDHCFLVAHFTTDGTRALNNMVRCELLVKGTSRDP